MKKTILFLGAILFVFGFCLCTGVDQNPWQAVYALVLMGGASWLFHVCDRMDRKDEHKNQADGYRDAA